MRAKHWKSNNFVIFQQGVGRKRGVEYQKNGTCVETHHPNMRDE